MPSLATCACRGAWYVREVGQARPFKKIGTLERQFLGEACIKASERFPEGVIVEAAGLHANDSKNQNG